MADHKTKKTGKRKARTEAPSQKGRPRKAEGGQRTHRPAESGSGVFTCFQCGAEVPSDSDRCPKCRSFYVRGVRPDEVDELIRAEEAQESVTEDFVDRIGTSVFHFDADTGVMRFIGDRLRNPHVSIECARCGTFIEFSTDRCPMCGTKPGREDSGLISVFEGMAFDPGPLEDADCPFCGERVSMSSGRCPECSTDLGRCDERDPTWKVNPVLRMSNVVFLHLDIETGEISVLQRNPAGRGYDHAFMRLDQVAAVDAERGWCGSPRG